MARKKQLDEELEIVDETNASEIEDAELDAYIDSLSDEELADLQAKLESSEEEETEEELDEAADGTGGVPDGASKTNLLSIAMKKLGSATPDQIAGFYKSLEKFNPGIPDGASAKNQASISMKPSDASAAIKESIKEDLDVVFGDNEELSEDFKVKVSTLFESALAIKEEAIKAELEEAYEKSLTEATEEIVKDLTEKVDSYISYIAEEFVKENELAIETSIKTELSESFLQGLYKLFAEHNLHVPDEDIEATELLAAKVQELEEQLDASIKANIDAVEAIKEYQRADIVEEKLAGLTQVQVDKFIKLAESIEFNGNAEEYSKKLEVIKESNFINNADKKTNLITEEHFTEDDDETENIVHDPNMQRYLAATRKTVKSA